MKTYDAKDILEYTVMLVGEFARRHGLTERQAFSYISRFKGMPYILEGYDALHTLSLDDGLADVAAICKRNGGAL